MRIKGERNRNFGVWQFCSIDAGTRINRGLHKACETVIIKSTEKKEGVSVGTKVRKCRYKGRKCRQNEV